jgi:hypothetical protein
MNKVKALLSFGFISATFLITSSQVHALTYTIPLPYAGIGMRISGGVSRAYIASSASSSGTNCTFYFLGNLTNQPNGGLYQNTTINGTASADVFGTNGSSGGSWCGYTWQALVNNGYSLTLNGNAGNDRILNTTTSKVTINGNAGNDSLQNNTSYNATYCSSGGAGNDLISMNASDYAVGGDGDDWFLTGSTTAYYVNGNGGTSNRRCGNKPTYEYNIQSTICD